MFAIIGFCCVFFIQFSLGWDVSRPKEVSTLATCKVSSHQFQALHDLYNATKGENWRWNIDHKKYGIPWNFTAHNPNPCSDKWQYLVCNSLCEFTSMSLQNINMAGTLPESLTNLNNLTTLLIQSNPLLAGPIPSSINKLSLLTQLSLIENSLTGQIPANIIHLIHLTKMELPDNLLSGPLPSSIGRLINLLNLDLGNNRFTGPIPNSIGNITKFSTMYLDSNQFSQTLPASFIHLKALIKVKIGSNQLTGSLPPGLFNLKGMTLLDFGTNHIQGTLASNLANWKQIIDWYASYNHLSGSIPNSISSMTALTYFLINNNHLTGTIPTSLTTLTKLLECKMYQNHFNGTIPSTIGNLQALQTLKLSRNQLTGTLPVSINQLSKVSYLYLNNNNFVGNLAALNFTTMKALESMDISQNSFTGSIPLSLLTISLTFCNLSYNQFTGSLPVIHGYEPIASSLVVLDVSNNLLIGSMRAYVEHLSTLYQLLVNDNQFSGAFEHIFSLRNTPYKTTTTAEKKSQQQQWGYSNNANNNANANNATNRNLISSLRSLNIGNNGITGQIHDSFFQEYPNITEFIALQNCITGSIPNSICEWNTTLKTLIMDGLYTSKKCQQRFYPLLGQYIPTYSSAHTLSSTIPRCLYTSFPSLGVLHAAGNGIRDQLPSDILAVSNNLTDLSIAHNQFTGTIPLSFQYHPWEYLDLSFNKFIGMIDGNITTAEYHIPVPYTPYVDDDAATTVSGGADTSNVNTTMTNVTIHTLSIYLNNNRLSGTIPNSLLLLPNINILEGNLFDCTWFHMDPSTGNPIANTGSNLPIYDPHFQDYTCGTHVTIMSICVWIASVCVIGLIVILGYCLGYHTKPLPITILINKQKRWKRFWSRCIQYWEVESVLINVQGSVEEGVLLSTPVIPPPQFTPPSPPPPPTSSHDQLHSWKVFLPLIPRIRMFYTGLKLLNRLTWYVCAFIVLYILPCCGLFAGLSYKTYSNTYIWNVSIAFTSGIIPTVLFILGILLFGFMITLTKQSYFPFPKQLMKTSSNESATTSTITLSTLEDPIKPSNTFSTTASAPAVESSSSATPSTSTSTSSSVAILIEPRWKWIATMITSIHHSRFSWYAYFSGLVIGNIFVVLSVNMCFVFSITSYNINPVVQSLLAFLLSIFKLVWNRILVYQLYQLRFYIHHTTSTFPIPTPPTLNIPNTTEEGAMRSNTNIVSRAMQWLYHVILSPETVAITAASSPIQPHEKELFSINMWKSCIVWLTLFNNLACPCIATAFINPNCLYYTLTPSPEITSSYTMNGCFLYYYNNIPSITCDDPLPFTSSFAPPFFYTYQCSSSILNNFIYVFLFRYLVSDIIIPIYLMLLKALQEEYYHRYITVSKDRYLGMNTDTLQQDYLYAFLTKRLPETLRMVTERKSILEEQRDLVVNNNHESAMEGGSREENEEGPRSPESRYTMHEQADASSLQVIMTSSSTTAFSSYMNATKESYYIEIMMIELITDISILITFGMLFPLLAIIGCISIIFHNILRMIVVGRLFILYDYHTRQLTATVQRLSVSISHSHSYGQSHSQNAHTAATTVGTNHIYACQEVYRMIYNIYDSIPLFAQWMKQSYVPLVFWMYFLWSWFLFDMIGDQYGYWPAVSVFICMLGMNWGIFLGMELYQISVSDYGKTAYGIVMDWVRSYFQTPNKKSSSLATTTTHTRSMMQDRQQSVIIEEDGKEEEDVEDTGMEMSIIINPMTSK